MADDLRTVYAPDALVRVEFLKWDDRLHYWWDALVLEVAADRLLVGMSAGTVFHHASRGYDLRLDHDGRIAFWRNRWYSGGPDLVAGDLRADPGRVIEYYFNVGAPPEFAPGRVRSVDLELDIKVRPDLTLEAFDLDEFEAARARYGYPAWLARRVRDAAREVERLVARREWPVLAPQSTPDGFRWMDRGPSLESPTVDAQEG